MECVVKFPGMDTMTFKQGHLGQCSPKPTTFLYCRLPTLQRRVREQVLPRSQWGASTSIGRQGQEWATAPLKQFPPALNVAIAHAICDAVEEAPTASQGPLPECIDLLLASDHACATMGPDFVRKHTKPTTALQARRDAAKMPKTSIMDVAGADIGLNTAKRMCLRRVQLHRSSADKRSDESDAHPGDALVPFPKRHRAGSRRQVSDGQVDRRHVDSEGGGRDPPTKKEAKDRMGSAGSRSLALPNGILIRVHPDANKEFA